jgi:hypothetical protein
MSSKPSSLLQLLIEQRTQNWNRAVMTRWPLFIALTMSACGGKAAMKATPSANGIDQLQSTPRNSRDQINTLSERIRGYETQLQLQIDNSTTTEELANVSTSIPLRCLQSVKPLCIDSCTLGSSICDDAGKICELASTLAPDVWAADTCSRAKQSCIAATKRCCECD